MKYFTILLIVVSSNFLFSQQRVEKELDSIATEQDAITFLDTNENDIKGKILTFNEVKHKSSLAKDLLGKGAGGKLVTRNNYENIYYKVIEQYTLTHYRASIIYFDSNKLSVSEINTARNRIVSSFNRGKSFSFLAKQYSTDATAKRGGDLGWFIPGTYDNFLEDQIIAGLYNNEDIFLAENGNDYYVILLTYNPMEIKEAKVLKVVEPAE